MLEVKHVTKSYIKGGTPAIEDISFQVKPKKMALGNVSLMMDSISPKVER